MDKQQFSDSVVAFEQSVLEGVRTSNWTVLNQWVYEECTDCGKIANLDDPPIEVNLFNAIITFLDDADFLSSNGAYNVLKILENEWGRFSEEQRNLVLPLLENSYVRFSNSTSHFLIAELLGEYYADAAALEALRTIKIHAAGNQRNFLPMGFQLLIQNAKEESMRTAALSELSAMEQGEQESVQKEVKLSLARIMSQ